VLTTTRVTGHELLDGYVPESFFFATPRRALLAGGCVPVDPADPAPLVVGALPFDSGAAPHLLAPRTVRSVPEPWRGPGVAAAAPVSGAYRVRAVPEPARYETAVRQLLARFGPALDKVVLARALDVDAPAGIDGTALLRRLAARDPDGYLFAAALPSDGGALVGATPELLVEKAGDRVVSHPLAGSRPRGATPEADRAAAAELRASPKDRYEHDVVVAAIADTLRPYCAGLDVAEPALARTDTMWHLGTRITGRLRDPGTTSLELARALHPTPAVCGRPTAAARALIGELEPFDREFFTGAVGWYDWAGDGQWVVSIRCARVRPDTARLYAGAGIVPGSDPAAEAAETGAKFGTLLRALGLDT